MTEATHRPWAEMPVQNIDVRTREVDGTIPLTGAVIRHPDSQPGRKAAERLRAGLAGAGATGLVLEAAGWAAGTREQTGGSGTVGSDLGDPPASPTTILLGALSSNSEIARLYHAWLCPVDDTFPGRGGYFVRSYRDVYGDGATVLVVGTSHDDDLDQAVDRLLELLQGPGDVDHVHEVRISQTFRGAQPVLDPEHELYTDFRSHAQVAYRTRTHRGYTPYLSHLAEMHLLTGEPMFAQRYLELMQDMIIDTAAWVPDRWGRWGFDADFQAARLISSWHAIADSPAFSAEDREGITSHLIDYLGHCEEKWHGLRHSPYPARHNHFTFASLGLLVGALLLGTVHRLPQTRSWVDMADECFTPMLTAGKATEDCEAYGWLTLAHTLRYAVLRPVPTYFRAEPESESPSPCANLLLRGVTTMDNLGCQVPYGDSSAYRGTFSELDFWRPAAWLLADAHIAPLIEKKEQIRPPERRGVTGLATLTFRYDLPPTSRPAEELTATLGVTVLPLDEAYCATHAGTDPAPPDGFDKISFRDDFDAESPYLLLDGIDNGGHGHRDAGAIIRYTSRDRIWLEDAEYDKISANFHNTVVVARDGLVGEREAYAHLGEVGDDGRVAFAQCMLRNYSGGDWTRSVLWLRGVGFVVVDEVVAKEAGGYEATALWRSVGAADNHDQTWSVTMGEAVLRVHTVAASAGTRRRRQVAEDYVAYRSDWTSYPYAESQETVLQDTLAADLAPGDRLRLVHLLTESDSPSGLEFVDGAVRGFVGDQGFCLDVDHPLRLELTTSAEPVVSAADGDPHVAGTVGRAVQPVWSAAVGDGPLAVLDSRDTVASGSGAEVAIWRHGSQVGSVTTAGTVTALGPGPHGGFVAGQDGGRIAAYTANGDLLWEQSFLGHMNHEPRVNVIDSARLIPDADPVVVIGTESCHVHAYTADGKELWRYEVVHAASGIAAADLDDDGIDEVLAISEYWSWHVIGADGRSRCTVRGVEGSGGDHVIGHRGLAVFGGWDGHVTAYRPDGERVWDVATGDIVLALVPDGDDLLAACRAGRLYRIAKDGSVRWQQSLPVSDVIATPDGIVVACGSELRWLTVDGSVAAVIDLGTELGDLHLIDLPGSDTVGVAVRDIAGQLHSVASPTL